VGGTCSLTDPVFGEIAMVDAKLALVCARLCRDSYRAFLPDLRFPDLPDIEPKFIESQDGGLTDTQAAILPDPISNRLYIVFRGSDQPIDWINNVQFRQQIYPYGDGNSEVRFHQGFMTAYFAIRKALLDVVDQFKDQHIIATGHSLGGALATIGALDLQYNLGVTDNFTFSVYTYGAPRVGNQALVESFNRRIPDSYRLVYGWDVVTRVPRDWQGYSHVDRALQLGNRWTWQVLSRRFSDHAIIRYIEGIERELL
jgi:triacylglycerol lipase